MVAAEEAAVPLVAVVASVLLAVVRGGLPVTEATADVAVDDASAPTVMP